MMRAVEWSLDPATVSTVLVTAASLLGWLYTQSTSRSKALREELRWRRKRDSLRDRYIYRLEEGYNKIDKPLPDKPDGLAELDDAQW